MVDSRPHPFAGWPTPSVHGWPCLCLCCVPIYNNILHLSLESSQCSISYIGVPTSLPSNILVLAHMLPLLLLCSFGSHEPIHASGIGLLPKVLGVLTSIEHLHHGEHCTHSRTRTVYPLILVSDQHIAGALCPNCHGWIHLRKSTSNIAGKLDHPRAADISDSAPQRPQLG